VSISNGNTITLNVDDADAVVGNEYNTSFSVNTTTNALEIVDNGGALSVPLGSLASSINTDSQTLTAGTNSGEVSISNGNTIILNVDDTDADPTNEIQDLNLASKTLTITNNTTATPIDLTEVLDINDAADATISAPIENEILAYDGTNWVNKPLKDLQRVKLSSSYPAAPNGSPFIVGIPLSPSNGNNRFVNIDNVDILIIDNNSDNSFIILEDLDSNYDGKILKIVEYDNQNPKITTNSKTYYNTASPTLTKYDNDLFINEQTIFISSTASDKKEIKHESVEIIWFWDTSLATPAGYWIPMR
jgi:hypothetical protein